LITHSAAETEALGERLAAQLGPGDVVTLGGLAARVVTGEVEIDVPW